jgi:hypothetical protein
MDALLEFQMASDYAEQQMPELALASELLRMTSDCDEQQMPELALAGIVHAGIVLAGVSTVSSGCLQCKNYST